MCVAIYKYNYVCGAVGCGGVCGGRLRACLRGICVCLRGTCTYIYRRVYACARGGTRVCWWG